MTSNEFDPNVVGAYWLTEADEALVKITAFNIETRYPDMKRDFRRTCTAEFTAEQMGAIEEIFEWLKSQMTS